MIVDSMASPLPPLEVLRPLGSGATGTVELVRLTAPFAGLPAGTELARKTLAPGLLGEPAAHAAFATEIAAASAVRAPSLVELVHHGEHEGRPYLLLTYVPGKSLRELVEQGGPVPEPQLRAIASELADALAALHAVGLTHGDVKPENVRLDAAGRAVLLDLGFARRSRGEERRPEAGSLAYLAPERARGGGATAASDVFALGVVLYELATGLHPFAHGKFMALLSGRISSSGALQRRSLELPGADELLAALDAARFVPPSRLVPSLTPFLDRLLATVLARVPEERPAAQELALRARQGELGDWWRAELERGTGPVPEGAGAQAFPLVGRERELDALAAHYRALLEEEPARGFVIWLVGPEGSGKWRLVTTFAERLRRGPQPPLVLDARWNENDEGRPGGTALMLLNRWLSLPVGQAPGERDTHRLEELLGPAAARPLLASLDPRASGTIDRAVPGELARFLAELARARPVLVFLDDVHQAGPVTLGALSAMIELLRNVRVLFVLALREDVAASEPLLLQKLAERLERGAEGAGPHPTRLVLEPLDLAAVGSLVARLFDDDAPRVRLTEVLWKKSRGNPGFLTEILRELEARGGLQVGADGRYRLTVSPDQLPMPRSLDKLIKERLGALEPEERTWLERLAVVGARITPEFLLGAFPPTGRAEVDDVLARLVRKGWLVPAADRYRFERPALREALYRSLSPARRRRLHASAARGLAGSEDDLELAYQRAFHLHAAGEHAELLESVRRALPPLRRRASAQRLLTLARWALEALDKLPAQKGSESTRLELLEDAADAADRLGRREDQRTLLDHLAGFALDPETFPAEAARLYLLHARYAAGTGQFALARGWLKTAVSLAERSRDSWLWSQALRRLGHVQAQVGEFAEARALAEQALRRAVGENQEALAELALAHVDVLEDRLEPAFQHVERALATLRRTHEPRAGVLAYAELLRGRLWRSAGLPQRALGAIQRAVLLARRSGERRLEAEALARRGGLLLDLDQPALARNELVDAKLLSDEIEDRRGQVLSTLWLGLLEAEEGDARARASLERAVELARDIAFYRAEAVSLALLARLVRLTGDLAGAEQRSREAFELVARHGAELSDRIVIAGTYALLLGELGQKRERARVLDELERRVRASRKALSERELRKAQEAYAERLLASALSAEGPVFPRRR